MRHGLLHSFGVVTAAVSALVAGPAWADAVGPYYATPSWDQTLPASTRFIVLSNMAGAAVLDRETGLVWEKAPTGGGTWIGAQRYCNLLSVGNRQGWRLPTLQELTSLVDTSVNALPNLPAGHPFTITAIGFWSATTSAEFSGLAWLGVFTSTNLTSSPQNKLSTFNVWCVRGGQGVDPQ